MDYQKARSIRKKSLLSLINQQKFGEGKSITASIGGAVSQKFQAKAKGIKESLDPLNWVRKATGKGAFGDFAVTGLGRLFGRSDKDIKAFGGIGRKKIKGKKDPQFTTIAAGPIKPLKRGDGVADVLAKMYNFMMQNEELHKLNHEIEKAFKQEEMDEDDRRHNELVRTIKKYLKVPKTPAEEKKDGGLFSGIMDFINDLKEKFENLSKLLTPMIEALKKDWLMKFITGEFGALFALPALGIALSAWMLDWSKDKEKQLADKGDVRGLEKQVRATNAVGGSEVMSVENEKLMDDLVGERLKESKTPEGQAAYQVWLKEHPEKTSAKTYNKDTGVDELAADYLKAKGYKATIEAPKKEQEEAYAWAKASRAEIKKGNTVSVPQQQAPATPAPPPSVPAPATPSTPTAQPVQKSANPPVPETAPTQASTGGDTQPIVSVNSSTNTIGDKSPPKIVQTNTARARNADLDRYLMSISVVV